MSTRRNRPDPGWGIVDTKLKVPRLYFPRTWPERDEAVVERADLLVYYPEDHEWSRRLQVGYYDGSKVIPDAEESSADGLHETGSAREVESSE